MDEHDVFMQYTTKNAGFKHHICISPWFSSSRLSSAQIYKAEKTDSCSIIHSFAAPPFAQHVSRRYRFAKMWLHEVFHSNMSHISTLTEVQAVQINGNTSIFPLRLQTSLSEITVCSEKKLQTVKHREAEVMSAVTTVQ